MSYKTKKSSKSPHVRVCLTDPLAGRWLAFGRSSPKCRPDWLPEAWPITVLRYDTLSPGRKGRLASPSAALNQSEPFPQPAPPATLLPPGNTALGKQDAPSSCLNPVSLRVTQREGGRGETWPREENVPLCAAFRAEYWQIYWSICSSRCSFSVCIPLRMVIMCFNGLMMSWQTSHFFPGGLTVPDEHTHTLRIYKKQRAWSPNWKLWQLFFCAVAPSSKE